MKKNSILTGPFISLVRRFRSVLLRTIAWGLPTIVGMCGSLQGAQSDLKPNESVDDSDNLIPVIFDGSLVLSSQEEVDAFCYTHVAGHLTISGESKADEGSTITHLDALSDLVSVNGNFVLSHNAHLPNLNGLNGLHFVKEDLVVRHNDMLADLTGLDSMHVIGGSFYITDNQNFTHMTGLPVLKTLEGGLRIADNPHLKHLNGLEFLHTLAWLEITKNDQLIHIDGLSNLLEVQGILRVSFNNSLQHINGLDNLVSVGRVFEIRDNPRIIQLPTFSMLTSCESLILFNNPMLKTLDGFPKLNMIDGISITENDSLSHVNGFTNLSSVDIGLTIADNDRLIHLGGFENLTSVGKGYSGHGFGLGGVFLSNNDWLVDVVGLSNIQTIVGTLNISDNQNLRSFDNFSNLRIIDEAAGMHSPGGGVLILDKNESLNDIDGLSQLTHMSRLEAGGGRIQITGNPVLKNLKGLSNLRTQGIDWHISHNQSLSDLGGLEHLRRAADFKLESNEGMSQIDALSNLEWITGSLSIVKNDRLNNLNGLSGLHYTESSVTIEDNRSLKDFCGVSMLLSFTPEHDYSIVHHGTKISKEEILRACPPTPDVLITYQAGFGIVVSYTGNLKSSSSPNGIYESVPNAPVHRFHVNEENQVSQFFISVQE